MDKVSAARNPIIRRLLAGIVLLLIILTLVFILDVSYGENRIPFITVVKTVLSKMIPADGVSELDSTIILQIRLPRAILAALVGAMLAMAGAALQGLLLNPLADPYTVGVSAGAALGAGIATMLGLGSVAGGFGVPIVAFFFAMGAMFTVYALARSSGRVSMHSFLLAGIVIGSFLWSLLSFILALTSGNPAEAQGKIIAWLMGSFDSPDPWGYVRIAVPFTAAGLVILFAFARDLNIFSSGEESAGHLGLETENLKLIVIGSTSLVTAAAVAVSGIIGFVGLVVPHIFRRLFGPDHRILIPTSAIGGACLTVLADLVSRLVLPPSGLPVGVVTAMLGAPFFLYLLKTSKT